LGKAAFQFLFRPAGKLAGGFGAKGRIPVQFKGGPFPASKGKFPAQPGLLHPGSGIGFPIRPVKMILKKSLINTPDAGNCLGMKGADYRAQNDNPEKNPKMLSHRRPLIFLRAARKHGLLSYDNMSPKRIKGINTAGQALHPPPAAASTASRGVLNPSSPHSLDHVRASTVAISLRSSIKSAARSKRRV
jgi:hypothetical protein